jgi:hypothetical protein
MPTFPEFKPIELEDRDAIKERLWEYQPETSEINFANFFIWRSHYGLAWSTYKEWLLLVGDTKNGLHALPPIGPPERGPVARTLLDWLGKERNVPEPRIDRADRKLVSELEKEHDFLFEPTRDHFDYLYRTQDLIRLEGKNYRAKRNHLNYLLRSHQYIYEPINESHIDACLLLSQNWCDIRRCKEDLNLLGEWDATREALSHFRELQLEGGVIIINGRVEAFTLGELLNEETVVVHIEKANTEIRGLYAAINQQFCEKRWANLPFVNREQDLGEAGLREAKLSYNPERLIEKFRVKLR